MDARTPSYVSKPDHSRVWVKGKFLYCGNEKLYIKGVTYGTFAPQADGFQFPPAEVVETDFALMARHGFNCVRTYTVPPAYLLDSALSHGLKVMVGLHNLAGDRPLVLADLPFISIVVCSYNGSGTIRENMEAVTRLDYPNYEVIVIDDGSRDNLADIVRSYPVQLISTPNRGLSSARNTAWPEARSSLTWTTMPIPIRTGIREQIAGRPCIPFMEKDGAHWGAPEKITRRLFRRSNGNDATAPATYSSPGPPFGTSTFTANLITTSGLLIPVCSGMTASLSLICKPLKP